MQACFRSWNSTTEMWIRNSHFAQPLVEVVVEVEHNSTQNTLAGISIFWARLYFFRARHKCVTQNVILRFWDRSNLLLERAYVPFGHAIKLYEPRSPGQLPAGSRHTVIGSHLQLLATLWYSLFDRLFYEYVSCFSTDSSFSVLLTVRAIIIISQPATSWM